MLNRRNLLLSGAAMTAYSLSGSPSIASDASADAGVALDKLFDKIMDQELDRSPEEVTALGFDSGARAWEKSKLDDRSLAAIADDKSRNAAQLAALSAFDPKPLKGMDEINYEVVLYGLKTLDDANKRYDYGVGGARSPYVISQLRGSYTEIPDFLDSQHAIDVKADADSYLARLEAFATVLDEEIAVARHDIAFGVVPPDFALANALLGMNALRGQALDKTVLTTSVARRAKEKNIPGDYQAMAEKIVSDKVYPALDRQIALVKEMQTKATPDAGVWKLPKGDLFYQDALISWTTSSMSPADIHQTGLDIIEKHTAEIDTIMRGLGMTQGSVGERLHAMYLDPKYQYPNTDEGKAKLLADLNVKVQTVHALLPKYFRALPKSNVSIKRIPKYTEASQPGGYYQIGSIDGKRPGFYNINLRNTAEVPSWTLPTLTYHESIPGHHLQLSIQQETGLPLIRKVSFFSSYIEGWALYAEQLASEMGLYDNDPLGKIGYLHDAMFRAVRLVVDTGLNAMRWSREQAIKFATDTLGDLESAMATEIERYCVTPGQACGYMLGKLTFLRLREKAKAALGPKFDIRDFHDAVLLCGAVPLTVVETVVDRYIKAKLA
jgi:uncharacterized protein (DUF885 family)